MEQNYLASLIKLSGGALVGKTRFQKTVYLLQELGNSTDFHFSYHHYGPYSESLAHQLDVAIFLQGAISEESKSRQSDGAKYSVFTSNHDEEVTELGPLSLTKARHCLELLNKENSTVLELAATIHWLKTKENFNDWEDELKVRKGSKVGAGRQEKAKELLQQLELI